MIDTAVFRVRPDIRTFEFEKAVRLFHGPPPRFETILVLNERKLIVVVKMYYSYNRS
jgi:hypothetical protein